MNYDKLQAMVLKRIPDADIGDIQAYLQEYLETIRNKGSESIVVPVSTAWTDTTTSIAIPSNVRQVLSVYVDTILCPNDLELDDIVKNLCPGQRCCVSNDGNIYFTFPLAVANGTDPETYTPVVVKLVCIIYDSTKNDFSTLGDQFLLPAMYFILREMYLTPKHLNANMASYFDNKFKTESVNVTSFSPNVQRKGY